MGRSLRLHCGMRRAESVATRIQRSRQAAEGTTAVVAGLASDDGTSTQTAVERRAASVRCRQFARRALDIACLTTRDMALGACLPDVFESGVRRVNERMPRHVVHAVQQRAAGVPGNAPARRCVEPSGMMRSPGRPAHQNHVLCAPSEVWDRAVGAGFISVGSARNAVRRRHHHHHASSSPSPRDNIILIAELLKQSAPPRCQPHKIVTHVLPNQQPDRLHCRPGRDIRNSICGPAG